MHSSAIWTASGAHGAATPSATRRAAADGTRPTGVPMSSSREAAARALARAWTGGSATPSLALKTASGRTGPIGGLAPHPAAAGRHRANAASRCTRMQMAASVRAATLRAGTVIQSRAPSIAIGKIGNLGPIALCLAARANATDPGTRSGRRTMAGLVAVPWLSPRCAPRTLIAFPRRRTRRALLCCRRDLQTMTSSASSACA